VWRTDILFGLAVLPAFLLMLYIRKKDKIEKEPKGLIASLFLLGALSTVSAVIIGLVAQSFVKEIVDEDTWVYTFIDAFFMVALVEEGGKFVMLRLRTWRNKEFNYTFDAVVYAVSVSLGFATLENILYVLSGTIGTAVLRGLLSVPGHAINAVFMGYYYGLAKRCEWLGDKNGKTKNLWKSLISAVLLHGFYDFCLMIKEDAFLIVFLIFEVIITVVTVKKVNKLSREDSPLGPPMGVGFNQFGGYFMQNPYYYDPNGYYRQYDPNMYNMQGGYNYGYNDQAFQQGGNYQYGSQNVYNGQYQQNPYNTYQGYGQQGYYNYDRYNQYDHSGYNNYNNSQYRGPSQNNNAYNGYSYQQNGNYNNYNNYNGQ